MPAWLLLALALLGGCSRGGTQQLNIDLRVILPEEWQAVSNWEPINIDADPEQEYLLFYRYDASITADNNPIDGPIGAVIYDPQTPTNVPEDAGENTSPPAPWLHPYALLPSYWQGDGYGFIAPPRQQERPEWVPVRRTEPKELENEYFEVLTRQSQAAADAQEDSQAPAALPDILPEQDELIVYGGSSDIGGPTHISIFWWSTPREGYGSTQISAPGGLRVEDWDGPDGRSPIRTVRARYPQYDRSLLCKESRYERQLDPDFTSTGAFRPAVYYVEGPRQLIFCYGIPTTPFYPEAVVLAYLLQPGRSGELVVEEAGQSIRRTLGTYAWVDALQYMATVDAFASRATTRTISTTVWATLVYENDGELETRLYAFTLEHVPANLSKRTTDQWRIVSVSRQS